MTHRTKGLLRLFDSGFVRRLLLVLLGLSALGVADGYVLLTLGEHFGKYIILAAAAATGFLALFFIMNSVRTVLARIRWNIACDVFPRADYARLAGVLIAAVLLLIPGFFTDALGLFIYLPPVARLIGHGVTARHDAFLREVYEYLKIGDM
ncbi:MAG: FxsA family protein [Spirochaetaceae bacterium]